MNSLELYQLARLSVTPNYTRPPRPIFVITVVTTCRRTPTAAAHGRGSTRHYTAGAGNKIRTIKKHCSYACAWQLRGREQWGPVVNSVRRISWSLDVDFEIYERTCKPSRWSNVSKANALKSVGEATSPIRLLTWAFIGRNTVGFIYRIINIKM